MGRLQCAVRVPLLLYYSCISLAFEPTYEVRRSHVVRLLIFASQRTILSGVQVLERTEIVWQIPTPVRAVLLLAHGCSHSAIDFFPKSSRCPTCIGESSYHAYLAGEVDPCFCLFYLLM